MTPNIHAKLLFNTYGTFKLDQLNPANCKHAVVQRELQELVRQSDGLLTLDQAGTSLEGRGIPLVKCGTGLRRVLLWSQMHGDESTATLALMDIFNLLAAPGEQENWIGEMLDEVTLYVVPMLNPDGAERRQRRSTGGIDINRDARSLVTPEATILRSLQRKLKPRFGFNLHDQELSSAGNTKSVTAIALLAPAMDEKKTMPLVRVRAVRVAAFIARALGQFIDGHIARYNDAHEPRAFGDNMQKWGTSTVLIESGHWPKDREKAFVRKLNYVAILSALRAISNNSFEDVDLDRYDSLPENGKYLFDLLIKDVLLEHANGGVLQADLGLNFAPAADAAPVMVTVKDVGDLRDMTGLEVLSGGQRRIPASMVVVDSVIPLAELLNRLQVYFPLP